MNISGTVPVSQTFSTSAIMNLKVILILLLSLIAIQSQGQSRYNVIYEQQLSQNFAAENFNAGLHLINYLDT